MNQNSLRLHNLSLQELETMIDSVFSDLEGLDKLKEAYQVAKTAHSGQTRDGKDTPYIVHPLRMIILMHEKYGINDLDLLIATLLHDAIEDSDMTFEEVAEDFGDVVDDYVRQLTRPRVPDEDNRPNAKYEAKKAKFEKQMNAVEPVRILKTVDLIDNMRSWIFIEDGTKLAQKFPRWMHEANLFYVPLAESLGEEYVEPIKEVIEALKERGYEPKEGDFQA